ncbi:hypothetical protein MPTK1_7g09230 [Marchantia polymorpha subsp. ruderalis]|uniref:Uncharacterized protein n=2 Tax=Marchantia polymorpha TaxID=3197 RepID=A0AAF6BXP6_MARPO|nr:hypothetical protein MARPO_0068s0076 [Marchantia polymorpha]BBN16780.1 hypothetical protein Mp_7g09230 [Marchantia polymorpha subsp. ruderalis]|eukprot:PTQ35863.1 hypothetical protein MARPO_0068s0076 [Marchantia polymorpha]
MDGLSHFCDHEVLMSHDTDSFLPQLRPRYNCSFKDGSKTDASFPMVRFTCPGPPSVWSFFLLISDCCSYMRVSRCFSYLKILPLT